MNLYGWSKSLFDLAVIDRADARARWLPPQWVGLKFFNVFGPNEYHKGAMASVLSKVFDEAKAGKPVRLFKSHREGIADGDQRRDFIYVDDVVAVVRWLLDTPRVNGIFNVGTGHARSFRDMIVSMFAAMGRAPNIEYVDMPLSIRNSYQYFTQADMTNLRRAGYNAGFTRLEDAVAQYVTRLSRRARSVPVKHAAMFDFDRQLSQARKLVILCIGDLMLDDFVYGEVSRISPEAPAPVIAVQREELVVGGAGNVARNIAGLGARCIFVGLIGGDDAAAACRTSLAEHKRLITPRLVRDPRPADDAQAALRVGAFLDASPACRLGRRQAGRGQDRKGPHCEGARGLGARRRGGAVRLRQGRADAERDPRRHHACARTEEARHRRSQGRRLRDLSRRDRHHAEPQGTGRGGASSHQVAPAGRERRRQACQAGRLRRGAR